MTRAAAQLRENSAALNSMVERMRARKARDQAAGRTSTEALAAAAASVAAVTSAAAAAREAARRAAAAAAAAKEKAAASAASAAAASVAVAERAASPGRVGGVPRGRDVGTLGKGVVKVIDGVEYILNCKGKLRKKRKDSGLKRGSYKKKGADASADEAAPAATTTTTTTTSTNMSTLNANVANADTKVPELSTDDTAGDQSMSGSDVAGAVVREKERKPRGRPPKTRMIKVEKEDGTVTEVPYVPKHKFKVMLKPRGRPPKDPVKLAAWNRRREMVDKFNRRSERRAQRKVLAEQGIDKLLGASISESSYSSTDEGELDESLVLDSSDEESRSGHQSSMVTIDRMGNPVAPLLQAVPERMHAGLASPGSAAKRPRREFDFTRARGRRPRNLVAENGTVTLIWPCRPRAKPYPWDPFTFHGAVSATEGTFLFWQLSNRPKIDVNKLFQSAVRRAEAPAAAPALPPEDPAVVDGRRPIFMRRTLRFLPEHLLASHVTNRVAGSPTVSKRAQALRRFGIEANDPRVTTEALTKAIAEAAIGQLNVRNERGKWVSAASLKLPAPTEAVAAQLETMLKRKKPERPTHVRKVGYGSAEAAQPLRVIRNGVEVKRGRGRPKGRKNAATKVL